VSITASRCVSEVKREGVVPSSGPKCSAGVSRGLRPGAARRTSPTILARTRALTHSRP